AEGDLIRVDSSTFPYRNTSGGDAGSWATYDPSTNLKNYFNFVDGGWWRDSWSWMYVQESASTVMQFKFNGTTIALDMLECGECGQADIYLDGQLQQRVDSNAIENKQVRAFEKSGLEDGDHTLEIRGVDSEDKRYIRIAGFEFRHFEDPNAAKFWSEDTFFKAG
ncbi:hypothetical protein K0U00_47420, partial [Paenibacillus sepulcri]|nr:hypothetical protein [Paenibacillus sepulcri]